MFGVARGEALTCYLRDVTHDVTRYALVDAYVGNGEVTQSALVEAELFFDGGRHSAFASKRASV